MTGSSPRNGLYPTYIDSGLLRRCEQLDATLSIRRDLAKATTDRAPRWVVFSGPTGAGKSTLAAAVAACIGIRYIICTDMLARVWGGESNPFRQPTHRAWKLVSNVESEDAHRLGLEMQYSAAEAMLEDLLVHSVANVQHIILEGAVLYPANVDRLLDGSPVKCARIQLTAPIERVLGEFLDERSRSTFMHKPATDYGTDARRRYRFLYSEWDRSGAPWDCIYNDGALGDVVEATLRTIADCLGSDG